MTCKFILKYFSTILQKSDVDKQLLNMRTVEFNMAPQKIKFEEELIALQATVDSTTRQNDVFIFTHLCPNNFYNKGVTFFSRILC